MGEPTKETDHHATPGTGSTTPLPTPSTTTPPLPPLSPPSTPTTPHSEPAPFAPQVKTNTPCLCIRCEYDLVGLGPGGCCPECGLDADVSRRHEIEWPRGYLKALRRSVLLTRAPGLVLLAFLVALMFADRISRVGVNVGQTMWWLLQGAIVAWAIGVALLSRTADTRASRVPAPRGFAAALSHWGWIPVTVVAGGFVVSLLIHTQMPSLTIPIPSGGRGHPASLPLATFTCLLVIQHMAIVAEVANKIPHDDLRISANTVRTLTPCCLILFVLAWINPLGRHWTSEFTVAILVAATIGTALALLMLCENVGSALRQIRSRRNVAIQRALAASAHKDRPDA